MTDLRHPRAHRRPRPGIAALLLVGAAVVGGTPAPAAAQQQQQQRQQASPPPAADAIAPGDSARPETIERLLQAMDAERLYDQSVEAGMAAQLKASPQLAGFEDILRAFMQKYASYAVIKPDLVRIYHEVFSEADLQETIRFYQSPFGKRLMSKMPLVMARSAELSTAHVQAHLPELMQMISERMQQNQKKGAPPSSPPGT